MAEGNNIRTFTALDIEKYHKGLLSAADMHALEKAAMDDPFLAEAIEGYSIPGVNPANDIKELKDRLDSRTGKSRVIPMKSSSSRNFNLLRAAVILVFVAGAGLLIYQFGFNNKKSEIAQSGVTETKQLNDTTTSTDNTAKLNKDSAADTLTGKAKLEEEKSVPVVNLVPEKSRVGEKLPLPVIKNQTETQEVTSNKVVTSTERGLDLSSEETDDKKKVAPPVTSTPRNAEDKPGLGGVVNPKQVQDKNSKEQSNRLNKAATKDESSRDEIVVNAYGKRESPAYTNSFRGRVTDMDNSGVPFANLSDQSNNTRRTYTDANGYFNFSAPDSVVNVQVRSVGYENKNVQLRNDVARVEVKTADGLRGTWGRSS